jgi:hypothetical protein
VPVRFGGLTLPGRGSPIPSRLLIAETARLRCDFGVLRRSFLADVPPARAIEASAEIRRACEALDGRSALSREELESLVRGLRPPAANARLLNDAAAGG